MLWLKGGLNEQWSERTGSYRWTGRVWETTGSKNIQWLSSWCCSVLRSWFLWSPKVVQFIPLLLFKHPLTPWWVTLHANPPSGLSLQIPFIFLFVIFENSRLLLFRNSPPFLHVQLSFPYCNYVRVGGRNSIIIMMLQIQITKDDSSQ